MQGRDRIDVSRQFELIAAESCEGIHEKISDSKKNETQGEDMGQIQTYDVVLNNFNIYEGIGAEDGTEQLGQRNGVEKSQKTDSDWDSDSCDEFYDAEEELIKNNQSDRDRCVFESRTQSKSSQQETGISLERIFLYPVKSCAGFEVRQNLQWL